MSDRTESAQQRAALWIIAGIAAIALLGLQLSGAISDSTTTAVVWFAGLFVIASCLLKVALPRLSNRRR